MISMRMYVPYQHERFMRRLLFRNFHFERGMGHAGDYL